MEPITLRLQSNTLAEVDSEAEDRGESRAEYIRELIEHRHDYEAKASEYEEKADELQREVDRLHRERRQILEQREEHTELVSAVKSEQSLAERKAKAGLGTRLKWWAFGMEDDS